MHSAGQDLNFFQYHNLDVFAVILLFDLVIIALFVYFCKMKLSVENKDDLLI